MPGGDRTGPMGWGAMTGRAAGYCAGFGTPGYLNAAAGRGFGWGYGGRGGGWGRGFSGGGRGWRHMFYATGLPGWARYGSYGVPGSYTAPSYKPDPEVEKTALKNQAQALQSELDLINKRLSDIESSIKENQG